MSDFFDKTRQLQSCVGFEILAEIRSIRLSLEIYRGNFHDLRESFESYSDPAQLSSLWNPPNSQELDKVTLLVMRQLHNYLASVKSLVDHTRRIVRSICSGQAFLDEYQERVKRDFISNDLSCFVQELRNFTLHRELPLRGPSISATFNPAAPENGVVTGFFKLDLPKLMEWNGWSAASKRYLASVQPRLLLHEPIFTYHEIVTDFYSWLETRLREVFNWDIAEEGRLREEIRAIVAKRRNI